MLKIIYSNIPITFHNINKNRIKIDQRNIANHITRFSTGFFTGFSNIIKWGGGVMYKDDDELLPRTYSLKGYRIKKPLNILKIIKYLTYLMILIFIAGIAFLSVTHII